MNNAINDFRKKKNLTVEEFSKQLGCSMSLITKIIYGNRSPSKKIIQAIKKQFPEIDTNIFFES